MKELKLLGLTNNEIKVYLAILKDSPSTGTEVKQKTDISNSQVYSSLNTLIKKGVVTYEKHVHGKIYSAVDPKIISSIMHQRTKEIENIIPHLESIKKINTVKTNTTIYEGMSGFRTAFLKLVNDCPRNETIYIIGFSNQVYKNESLRIFLKNLNLKSKKKKHHFKIILDSKDNKFAEDRKKEGISTIRFMPKGFFSPAAIDIFQDYVYIFLWDVEPYVFMIHNKNIADGFKSYFNFLWKMAKP